MTCALAVPLGLREQLFASPRREDFDQMKGFLGERRTPVSNLDFGFAVLGLSVGGSVLGHGSYRCCVVFGSLPPRVRLVNQLVTFRCKSLFGGLAYRQACFLVREATDGNRVMERELAGRFE